MDNNFINQAPPKTASYFNCVILPRRGFQQGDKLPDVRLTWRDCAIDREHLLQFQIICKWESMPYLPFIYPLTIAFHYHLGIFARRDFPWSLRKLLGLRNHVLQHRRIKVEERLDLSVHVIGLRVYSKGLEFDIHTSFSSKEEIVWESVHVYYLRGKFAGTHSVSSNNHFEPLTQSYFETQWMSQQAGGWEFALLPGDLNPVHYFTPWAKILGFRRGFCHTQRVISDCIHALPNATDITESGTLRLDIAFKNPVYYGSKLTMKSAPIANGHRFDLYSGDSSKPAMPGAIYQAAANHNLLDALKH